MDRLRRLYLSTIGLGGFPLPGEPKSPVAAAEPPPDRGAAMEEVRTELGDCRRCPLGAGRNRLVFGTGDPASPLVFVGEAPGADEDRVGEPFVGAAGQLLTRIIEAMGFTRGQVYICNVLKCRPPGNRDPLPAEVASCLPFLVRQLAVIRPRVVVTLGKHSTSALLGTADPISRLRGRFHQGNGFQVMPTFHPSYLLRTPEAKREVWADMRQVMAALGLPPR